MTSELAQVNIGRLAAPLDSAQLVDFVAGLAPVNALAEAAPGFRWRLQDDAGNATSIAGFRGDGPDIIVNMSTWADVESLSAFVFGPMHAAFLRRRREFFVPLASAYTVCWWVPAGHRPTVTEAENRLDLLRREGPGATVFTLKRPAPPPELMPVARGTS